MVRCTASVLIVLLAASSVVRAEGPTGPPVTNIRASIDNVRFDLPSPQPRLRPPHARFQQQHKPMSTATKITVGFVGAFLGMFAGGAIGAALQPSCSCDDPGLTGFMIGAPVGAVLGAIGMIRFAEQ